jgi:hypothetical protein
MSASNSCWYRVYTVFVTRSISREMTRKSIQRRGIKTQNKSTHNAHKVGKLDAGRSQSELERRVKKLEDWVASQIGQKSVSPRAHREDRIVRLGKKRGPKTISGAELDSRRDELVRFLESNWPELQLLCGPEPKPEELKRALVTFRRLLRKNDDPIARANLGTVDDHRAAAHRLLENLSQLETFLMNRQDRFAGDPRQIANEMAGCPNMGFWTSLKRCQQRPFRVGIHPRAMRAYIERKHPRLYTKLLERPSLPELAVFWNQYRTKDKVLAGLKAVDLDRGWTDGNLSTKLIFVGKP